MNSPLSRERLIRLAVLGMMWDWSYTISLPLGAWLFNSGSYVCVFGTSLLLNLLSCLLAATRLWGFKEKINKSHLNFKGLSFFLCLQD